MKCFRYICDLDLDFEIINSGMVTEIDWTSVHVKSFTHIALSHQEDRLS